MSNDYTTDAAHPNIPEDGKRERFKVYIEDTVGLRVRKNKAEDALEIWLDGEILAAWIGADNIEVRFETMMRTAFDAGRNAGIIENQNAMRHALGLEEMK